MKRSVETIESVVYKIVQTIRRVPATSIIRNKIAKKNSKEMYVFITRESSIVSHDK